MHLGDICSRPSGFIGWVLASLGGEGVCATPCVCHLGVICNLVDIMHLEAGCIAFFFAPRKWVQSSVRFYKGVLASLGGDGICASPFVCNLVDICIVLFIYMVFPNPIPFNNPISFQSFQSFQ